MPTPVSVGSNANTPNEVNLASPESFNDSENYNDGLPIDNPLGISPKPNKVRDSTWTSNFQETDLVVQGDFRSLSVSGRNETESKPVIFTFPLSGLDEAYKDPR